MRAHRSQVFPDVFSPDPWVFCKDPEPFLAVKWLRWGHGKTISALHCFVDDYRIEVAWRRPGRGLIRAIAAGVVTAPDFSVSIGFPPEIADYQAFKSAVVAEYWISHGVHVLPVLQWSEKVPNLRILPGSLVSVRGHQRGQDESLYEAGLLETIQRYQPSGIFVFGSPYLVRKVFKGPVYHIKTHGGFAQEV